MFQGDTVGRFSAYDARTGERRWSSFVQSGIIAAPVSYAIGGRQFVAVVAGSTTVPGNFRTSRSLTNNSRLLVFALDGTARLPTNEVTGTAHGNKGEDA